MWGGLAFGLILVALKLAVMGHTRVLQFLVAGVIVGGFIFYSSPLYDTVTLRAETGHSDGRRETVASEVISKTVSLSPSARIWRDQRPSPAASPRSRVVRRLIVTSAQRRRWALRASCGD